MPTIENNLLPQINDPGCTDQDRKNFNLARQIGRIINLLNSITGGTEPEKIEDNAPTSLSGNPISPVIDKINFTTVQIQPPGIYKISFTAQIKTDSTSKSIRLIVKIQAGVVFDESFLSSVSNQYILVTGFFFHTVATPALINLNMQFQKDQAGNYTASIQQAKMDIIFWKV